MKLTEAIEIKEQYLRDNQPYDLEELEVADKILTEAGKRLIWARGNLIWRDDMLLPGETED